ncbi:protein S100-G-like [Rhinatrema bivittatum]|uniref:protein S100-G-like n=1 Tax=Rhinatrema bivittatum TaxID=194408 RepID=UPI001126A730|nr:protein S100-G-like [Rhinatrema bivittatum]
MASCNLETVINNLIQTFDKYARSEGDKGTLSPNELCALARNEFPSLCKDTKSEAILTGILGDMDLDGDKEVTFKEFVLFLCFLTMAIKEIKSEKK